MITKIIRYTFSAITSIIISIPLFILLCTAVGDALGTLFYVALLFVLTPAVNNYLFTKED